MRKMNTIASGFGVIAILIPFIISIIFTGVSLGLGDFSSTGGLLLFTPDNYHNLTAGEREQWLEDLHGGAAVPTQPDVTWFHWAIVPWGIYDLLHPNYVFPDGTILTQDEFMRFIHGEADKPDYFQVTLSVLSLNPPLLLHLPFFGILVRIILIVSVCLGLAEIIWIG